MFFSIWSASAKRSWPRSCPLTLVPHVFSKASRAAWTARSTSSLVAVWICPLASTSLVVIPSSYHCRPPRVGLTVAITSSVAGSTESSASPRPASHSLLMNSPVLISTPATVILSALIVV